MNTVQRFEAGDAPIESAPDASAEAARQRMLERLASASKKASMPDFSGALPKGAPHGK